MRTLALLLLAAAAAAAQEPGSGDRLKALEERVAQLEGARAKTSQSAFNPAMGAALDLALESANDKARSPFRAAEVNLESPIDPFAKGWIVLTGNRDGVEVEEATVETTALPYNLTARGGRLFASFGRLAHFHDHELPFIDRPKSLDDYVGGEARGDGAELSWLAPTDLYASATLGVYDKLGADNDRAGAAARALDEFTYLARASVYKDLADDHSVELGADVAWTPKRTVAEKTDVTGSPVGLVFKKNTWRSLAGLDFTYRYQPTAGGLYKGLIWGTEVLQSCERRFDGATNLPTDRTRAYAGFTYVQLKMGPRWRPGLLADLTEDLDVGRKLTSTYAAFLTYDATEFQRLRLQYSDQHANVAGSPRVHSIGLQWTAVLGHHVHGFRDR